MPRYSVRMYSSYVDEYEVEAASQEEAIELADAWQYCADFPQHESNKAEYERLSASVEQITKHEYVDHDDTMVSELDKDGNWLDAE